MEQKKIVLEAAAPGLMGVTVESGQIRMQTQLQGGSVCGVYLYPVGSPDAKPVRLDFPADCRYGEVYACCLKNCDPAAYTYSYHVDGAAVPDRYARRLTGHRLFGKEHLQQEKETMRTAVFTEEHFSWKADSKPGTPYENSIYYGMHIRGFTRDPSSGIREGGTFLGASKKIPYLKKLGITGVVLQPVYEFEECMVSRSRQPKTVQEAADQAARLAKNEAAGPGTDQAAVLAARQPVKPVVNYWGYLEGYYFAPKNAYAYTEDAVTELKNLIAALHRSRIEVILQFAFPADTSERLIREVLEFWSLSYHVDGFHLLGAQIGIRDLAEDPFLKDVKLWTENADSCMQSMADPYGKTEKRRLAVVSREFCDTMRCFLKGDENMLSAFLQQMRSNPAGYARINYLAGHGGFRLADVVSYERRHNEANGENNQDGETYNCSWNCGEEGDTGHRSILSLRAKLIRNALCFLLFAQGTPFLFMGDEYGKSGGGNNNPYCQDNEVTWLQWHLGARQKRQLLFTRSLIALRLSHPVLHRQAECRIMDTINCGYPDLSYHGREVWKPDYSYYVRHIGMMLCGLYEKNGSAADDSFYLAFNMHWESHTFALPKLQDGFAWRLLLDTEKQQTGLLQAGRPEKAELLQAAVAPRCIRIYSSVRQEEKKAPHRSGRGKKSE